MAFGNGGWSARGARLQHGDDVARGEDEARVEGVGDAEAGVGVSLGLGSGDGDEVYPEGRGHFLNLFPPVHGELVDAYQFILSARLLGEGVEEDVVTSRSFGDKNNRVK